MHIFLLLVYFYIVGSARALYFYMKQKENKCFLQELPSNTNLLGYYKSTPVLEHSSTFSLEEEGQKTKIKVEIKNPEKSITFSKLYRLEGVFSFTSHNPGSYLICLKSEDNNYSWNKLKIHFALQVGERAINYTAVAQKEKLTEIELKFKQLIEKASEVSKEQEYQRYREEMFRASTEKISWRILFWSVAQTIILILTGIWQLQNLINFFESKKLV